MTNEFKPLVRDPQQPVNMLQQPTAATPAEPLESLSFPDMREVEAVLSPQDVNKGLAQADPLTRHPRVSSIVLCVVFGLLMLAASAGVWWLGVRTMDGQSYEDIVWSKLDTALPGWLAHALRNSLEWLHAGNRSPDPANSRGMSPCAPFHPLLCAWRR